MSCRLFESELDAYFDGALNAESSCVIREHLLASLVRAAPLYSTPDHLRARVLAQTHRRKSVRRTIGC
jgi:hypothetical protein